jgi:hypothetical protein
MKECYEIQIVGYGYISLAKVPKPFVPRTIFTFSYRQPQNFATAGCTKKRTAVELFGDAWEWSVGQVANASRTAAMSVRLVNVMDEIVFLRAVRRDKVAWKRLSNYKVTDAVCSRLLSCFDVTIDSNRCLLEKPLQELLDQRGYELLQYTNFRDDVRIVCTKRFLDEDQCVREFHKIALTIDEVGGFVGTIAWRRPLGFLSYGEPLPSQEHKVYL